MLFLPLDRSSVLEILFLLLLTGKTKEDEETKKNIKPMLIKHSDAPGLQH